MTSIHPAPGRAVGALVLSIGLVVTACSSGGSSGAASTATETGNSGTGNSDTGTADTGTPTAGATTLAAGTAAAGTAGAAQSQYLGDYTLDDAEFGTQTEVTVNAATRTIHTNALPNHETGEFPNDGNPNTISAQDLTWSFPAEPTWTGDATPVGIFGVAVNGVKFEPGTAESVTCESGENYRVEGLQNTYSLGMDFNLAHVQPTGEYHYHGISQLLVDAYATDADLVHVGFASDGYLVYYSKSGAYTPGYALTTEPRVGTGCTGSSALGNAAVELNGTAPDGTYTSDWEWSAENGDLDSCNGTEIDGVYVYLMTDEYPYIGRCLNGEPSDDARAGGPPNGVAPGGPPPGVAQPGTGADLTEAAATLGVTPEELQSALGPPPPDLEAAAATLGVTVDELRAALPPPGQ